MITKKGANYAIWKEERIQKAHAQAKDREQKKYAGLQAQEAEEITIKKKLEWQKAMDAAIVRHIARLKKISDGRDMVCVGWSSTGEPIWDWGPKK